MNLRRGPRLNSLPPQHIKWVSPSPSQTGVYWLFVPTVRPGPADVLLQLFRKRIEQNQRPPMPILLKSGNGEFFQIVHERHLRLHKCCGHPRRADAAKALEIGEVCFRAITRRACKCFRRKHLHANKLQAEIRPASVSGAPCRAFLTGAAARAGLSRSRARVIGLARWQGHGCGELREGIDLVRQCHRVDE